MSDDLEKNVTNPYYSINSVKDFFGGTDPIRIVIIIYIFLSFILNGINFIVIGLTIKIKKKVFPIALWVMLSVLLMNFIHTFSYFFEWVIKEGVSKVEVKIKVDRVEVGALLTGNPKNISACKIQGFLLIFSSISQDFLINIFFYLVNSSQFNEFYSELAIIILGLVFPFIFTLILELVGAIGLNDQFCYVKKFDYTIYDNFVKYCYFEGFQPWVIIVYSIRVLNFIATVYFLIKILSYVKQENKPRLYIFKSIFIPIIQLFTIGIGVLYRFINLISSNASAQLSGTYLILNTVDGVLFPIGFALQNSIFGQIKRLIYGGDENKKDDKEETIEIMEKREEDEDDSGSFQNSD